MSIFSAFAKKPEAQKPSRITAVAIPESSFNLRQSMTPSTIINARSYQDRGQYGPILKAYQTFMMEDDSVASTVDVRAEALKAALVTISTEGLSQVQLDYFDALIRELGALWSDQLLELKLTGVLFRQIEYEIRDGLYWPKAYLEYPNADLRLVEGKILPFDIF